jgi:hypothetical protein
MKSYAMQLFVQIWFELMLEHHGKINARMRRMIALYPDEYLEAWVSYNVNHMYEVK